MFKVVQKTHEKFTLPTIINQKLTTTVVFEWKCLINERVMKNKGMAASTDEMRSKTVSSCSRKLLVDCMAGPYHYPPSLGGFAQTQGI